MAINQVTHYEFFRIESATSRSEPKEDQRIAIPFFGGPKLEQLQFRDAEGATHTMDERDKLAELLDRAHGSRNQVTMSPAIALQMLNISARQWEDAQGLLRVGIWKANHETMPDVLKRGERLFDKSLRHKWNEMAYRQLLRRPEHMVDWTVPDQHFQPENGYRFVLARQWYDDFWMSVMAKEAKTLSERFEDIQSNAFARADQIIEQAWSMAGKMGETKMRFRIENIKDNLDIPTSSGVRPPMDNMIIHINILVTPAQLPTTTTTDSNGEAVDTLRERFPPEISLFGSELMEIDVPGTDTHDYLAKLRHAIEHDLSIDFAEHDVALAWRNPRSFCGERNRLVRLRSNEDEFKLVLKQLRKKHLVEPGDRTIYLYLASAHGEELVRENEHPDWPEEYEMSVAISTAPGKEPKRKPGHGSSSAPSTPQKKKRASKSRL